MTRMQSIQAGRVLFVDEVLAQGAALRGSSVRVTGQCVHVCHTLCNAPSGADSAPWSQVGTLRCSEPDSPRDAPGADACSGHAPCLPQRVQSALLYTLTS